MSPTPAPSGSPLADATFRRLFIAQVASLVGTGLTTVALALLAHDLVGGDAGLVLGTVLAVKMVAYVLVAPIVGGLAHRLPRKTVLVGLDVVRAGIVLVLPWVSELWQVYVLVAALSVAAAGFTPLFQATVPDVLPDEARYTRALSLSRLAYDLENLASPTLAALALSVVGYQQLFVMDAVTFLGSAVLVGVAAVPPGLPPDRSRSTLQALTFGVRAYLGTPRLRGLLALHVAASAAGAMVIVNTVVLVREHLGLGEAETAWAMAAAGLGSMLVALAMPSLLRRIRDRSLMLAGAALSTLALLAGVLPLGALLPLLALWLAIGLGTSAVQTPSGRLVRRSCAPADRPALFSAEFALSHATWLLAYVVAGVVGSLAGLPAAFLALAALSAVGVGVAVWTWPRDSGDGAHEARQVGSGGG